MGNLLCSVTLCISIPPSSIVPVIKIVGRISSFEIDLSFMCQIGFAKCTFDVGFMPFCLVLLTISRLIVYQNTKFVLYHFDQISLMPHSNT